MRSENGEWCEEVRVGVLRGSGEGSCEGEWCEEGWGKGPSVRAENTE